jgi:hypothetical protein
MVVIKDFISLHFVIKIESRHYSFIFIMVIYAKPGLHWVKGDIRYF